MTEPIGTKANGKCRRLGFLVEPLGWVQARLIKAIEVEPRLIELLFDLDAARMHLLALALAHLNCNVTPDLALMLLQEPKTAILNRSVGHRPVGIGRVLRRLPPKVLAAESYRKLIDLLIDPATAKFLHHRQSIDEKMIAGLSTLPADLRRPAILAMVGRVEGMEQFVDGLRCLAARAGLQFTALTREIGSLNQPDQVVAKIKQVTESLPLLDTLPPVTVGPYRRLDQIAEIRSLAKDWQNCLADYMLNITDATCAIYRTDPPDPPAACFVVRQWRLGWFLQQAKGPRNIALAPDQLAQTYSVFADVGILQSSIIEAIKSMILTTEWSRHYPGPVDAEIFDDIALYCD
jgi:hypothetical protein